MTPTSMAKSAWAAVTLTIVANAMLAAQPDPRAIVAPAISFAPPAIDSFVTASGARVIFVENHELPTMQITALIRGGGSYDDPALTGLAEITARAMRSGGAGPLDPERLDEEIDFIGATVTSRADADKFTVALKCLRRNFTAALTMYADVLIRPRFDSARVALEISNKKDEILRQNDSPQEICRRIFAQSLYGAHPYGHYPTLESMDKIIRDNLVGRHGRLIFYPHQVIFAVSGDITRAELLAELDKAFKGWSDAGVVQEKMTFAPARATVGGAAGVYVATKDVTQTTLRMGHLGYAFDNPDRHALAVMNFALGEGFTSRLFAKVRSEAGLAYGVGSVFTTRPLTGAFFAYCQTKSESTADATHMIIEILQDVRRSGVTKQEFDLAKESLMNSFVFSYETPQQIVESVAQSLLDGSPADQTEKDLASLKSVTLADCNRVATQYLRPDSLVIVAVCDSATAAKQMTQFGAVTNVSLEIK